MQSITKVECPRADRVQEILKVTMLVSLTVGKVDAGVAVLLTGDKRLIEFPSILLPPSITSGSIVDIEVQQNFEAEKKASASFQSLQSRILNTYGLESPTAPALRLRNATQTSVVLEWDPLHLATSTLKSLSLYRNGSKAGTIPRPHDMLATKISGLAVDTEYTFHLVLRTTGGTYTSTVLNCRTHKMTDLSGITVTPGILPPPLKESLTTAVERIGAKLTDTIRIDTTHFVCTEGRGREWEKAREMNIPVVRPEWVEGCEREGRLVGVRAYYLDANPKDRVIGSNPNVSQSSTSTQQATQQQQRPSGPDRQLTSPLSADRPLSPGSIQQLPTASVSNTNLQLSGASQQSLERRMGKPMSPPLGGNLSRRSSAISRAEVPEGVEDGGPGPEVPPTPPPKDLQHRRGDSEDESDEDSTETELEARADNQIEAAKELGLADRTKTDKSGPTAAESESEDEDVDNAMQEVALN